jgi:hypothetical protein
MKGKKGKKARHDDDEDTKGKKAKAKRKAKDDDDDGDEDTKKSTKKRGGKVELSDSTVLTFAKKRSKGGPKTDLLNLIPKKKGITLKKLVAAAKEEDMAVAKVKGWAKFLVAQGYAEAA